MKTALIALVTLAVLACATPPRSERAAAPPRLKDSVPEKVAAQRAASGGLRLQDEEDRWGFEGARERRDDRRQAGKTTVVPLPPAPALGPRDGGTPEAR